MHREAAIYGSSTLLQPGNTVSRYDANGHLTGVTDSTQPTANRNFVNDAAGRALYAYQGGNVQRQLVGNGEVLARHGVGLNEAQPYINDNPNFAQLGEFLSAADRSKHSHACCSSVLNRRLLSGFPGHAHGKASVTC